MRSGYHRGMARTPALYPPELASYVVEHWPKDVPLRVSRADLCEALSVAFQVSLTAEEARALRFRLLLTPPSDLPEAGRPNEGVLRLKFDHPRAFNVDEVRRLAPSTPFESTLIGVSHHEDTLAIWGIAHSGPAWLSPAWGGRAVVPTWTHDPIVHVTGPGQLAVRHAGKLVGGLERGALVDTTMDVFDSEWLRDAFAREREEARAELTVDEAAHTLPATLAMSFFGRVTQHMLRRCIQLVRDAQHGGLILLADASCALDADTRKTNLSGLRLKFRFVDDEPSRRYRTILLRIREAVIALSKANGDAADLKSLESPALARLESAVFEWSRLIANLAAVDGAVVLDKRFSLVGFGAEVSTELPSPNRVYQAVDVEGHKRVPREIERVGTRHRAAYRFVDGHPNGLAIALSQDGGVTFVAKRAGDVVFWEQSVGR